MRLTGNVYVVEEDPVEHKAEEKGRRGSPSSGVVGRRGGSGESGFVFVKQEDLFYSQLTVREVLLFTARLRLSRKMADAEKKAYVDDMINRMGLTEAADTLIGDEKKRGISGGERKRLSLACELMGNPSKIIFADEPTSKEGGKEGGRGGKRGGAWKREEELVAVILTSRSHLLFILFVPRTRTHTMHTYVQAVLTHFSLKA